MNARDYDWLCTICDAPTTAETRVVTTLGLGSEYRVHRACYDAWAGRDLAALAQLRAKACEAGHHRSPGRWTADPADPYGDAQFWECTKGCGHVQRHPGYGTGKAIMGAGRG